MQSCSNFHGNGLQLQKSSYKFRTYQGILYYGFMMDGLRVVLVGHSYVRRLGQFMCRSQRYRNLGLQRDAVEVYGYGGATVHGGRNICRRLNFRSVANADVVFLHIGENDYMSLDPFVVADEIYSLAMMLVIQHGVQYVLVGELLPFPNHGRQWTQLVNGRLQQLTSNSWRVRFWRHRRAFFAVQPHVYCRDGVHVAQEFMRVYWNSVRFAVLSHLRHLPIG